MQVRCPHCHNPVEILDDSSFKDILCSTCGSNFSLVGGTDATETAHHAAKTIGQFELVEQLGVGAFGTDWKAKDTQLDRMVAIKIPRKGLLTEDETEKFLREARAAAQLRHASIVSVHEVGKSDDSVYIVSDYVEGADLKEWVRGQSLPAKEAAELCAKIAEALHHAHEQGVIHRDLKPGNIMMDLDGQPHIMDFGLAKRESGEMTMTVDGAILGTPAYMSPEQAKGKGHEADRRSDVYSLGTMLFEMLTGELPFRGEKRMLVVSILTEEPPKLRRLNPRVPKDLETICLKSMEKEPERRYATAKELADDLRRFVIGEPISARPIGITEYVWRLSRRHPARAGLTAASVVGLMLVVGLLVGYGYQQRLESANGELVSTNAQLAQAQEELDQVLYFRRVSQALSAWYENQVARAERLLEECPPVWRHWEWHYVSNLLHSGVITLKGHNGWVRDVAFSPDGKRIASASTDNTVKVWDAHGGREVVTLNGNPELITLTDFSLGIYYGFYCVAFSPDGKLIAAGSGNERPTDNEVKVHNTVTVWDAGSYKRIGTLRGHTRPIFDVAFSPDGTQIATASLDGSVRIWEVASGAEINSLPGSTTFAQCVAFSPDGERVAAASDDQTIKLWDAKSGRLIRSVEVRGRSVNSVAVSTDGSRIVSAGRGTGGTDDGAAMRVTLGAYTANVWDAVTGQELNSLEGHTLGLIRVALSPDGRHVATASFDTTAKVWNARTGQLVCTLSDHSYTVTSVSFSPGGQLVATGSWDYTVRIWDPVTGEAKGTLNADAFVNDVGFSPDGTRIIAAIQNGTVKVWDLASGQEALTIKAHAGIVSGVAFSPGGRRVASRSTDNTIKIWDAGTTEFIGRSN